MADSKQLDILKALTAHLEEITPENGYDVDLSNAVFRGRLSYGSDIERPFVTMIDAPRANPVDEVGEFGVTRHEHWDLLLQGWAADDPENPCDPVYQLKAAVEHRLARLFATNGNSGQPLYPDEYLLGGRVIRIAMGQGVVRPPDQAGQTDVCFYLPLTIERAADLSNPFVTE